MPDAQNRRTRPNFVHLGPDKSGSTWLHEVLILHPEMFLTEAKDLYFFNRYYDRGPDWYLSQFEAARPEHRIVGEVCPYYLAGPEVPARMRHHLGPDLRLMVTLREPAARAFSSYLYARKHGLGPPTFGRAIDEEPELVEHGRYGTQLRRYVEQFGREHLHVALFDDLQAEPQAFLDETTDWLGVARLPLAEDQTGARLPASRARFVPLAWAARRVSDFVREHDGATLIGRVKRSRLVHRALYRPIGDDGPRMSDAERDRLREILEPEVDAVEEDFGLPLRKRWGWDV